jgi:hypothetical protein
VGSNANTRDILLSVTSSLWTASNAADVDIVDNMLKMKPADKSHLPVTIRLLGVLTLGFFECPEKLGSSKMRDDMLN